MSGEISKEELSVLTQTTIKYATELEKIVSSLQLVVEKQDKIVDRVFNGMVHEIVDGITKNYDNTHKETVVALETLRNAVEVNRNILVDKIPEQITTQLQNSSIARDVEHTKWFVAIISIISILVVVFFRLTGINSLSKDNAIIEHLLKQHMTQTGNYSETKVSELQK